MGTEVRQSSLVQGGDPVDFSSTQVQQQMDDALELFRKNEFVVPGTLSSWWEGLKEFNNGTAPAVCTPPPPPFCCIMYSHHACMASLDAAAIFRTPKK